MNSTLDDVQDPQVAQKKIHWWHEELERMVKGEARHPATQACQSSFQHVAKTPSDSGTNPAMLACLAILSSVSDARFSPPSSLQDRDQQLIRNFSARLALLSHALSADANDLELSSHPAIAAEALAKHEQLERLPALLHRGQAVFSDETYKAHNVKPSELAASIRVSATAVKADEQKSPNSLAGIPIIQAQEPETLNAKKALIKAAIEDTHAALLKATIHPDVTDRYRKKSLLPLWRLIVLRRKQLSLWESKQPDLLREHMSLTPVSKLFHAWRNRR